MGNNHFHSGPWRGEDEDNIPVDPNADIITVREPYGDRIYGYYVRDQTSAGGKCWDWQETT